MKYLLLIVSTLFFSNLALTCDFIDENSINNSKNLMGKKSQFYDAYKQGKCVLEKVLKPLPKEQRKIIANLIAKTYIIEN